MKKNTIVNLIILFALLFFVLGCINLKSNKANKENLNNNSSQESMINLNKNSNNITNKKNISNNTTNNQINENTSNKLNELNLNTLPKFVNYNFIELNKISKISKFRSGAGHDFSCCGKETKTCRSMKHYFAIKGINESFWQKTKQINAENWPQIKYYSPVNGTITDERTSQDIFGIKESQFIIQSTKYPQILFDFFHVRLNKELKKGSEVKAGEFIGTVAGGASAEIAVSVYIKEKESLVSFFELLDNKVFREYQARGIKSVNELIISKKERDEKPLFCEKKEPGRFIGNYFTSNKEEYDKWAMGSDNWVFLTK